MRALIFMMIIATTACTNQTEIVASATDVTEVAEKNIEPTAKDVIIDPEYDRSTDPFSIRSAKVVGQQLHVEVSYSGGCEGHIFELFTDGHLMKSLPPKQSFFLRHYAHKDACKALIQETLFFDLSDTASQGNTLIILLQQYDGELRMDF